MSIRKGDNSHYQNTRTETIVFQGGFKKSKHKSFDYAINHLKSKLDYDRIVRQPYEGKIQTVFYRDGVVQGMAYIYDKT
jgi:hypothetical protein